MADVYESFSFGDRALTGKVIGDLTIDFCKTLAGDAVSQTGMTLTELGVGKYVLKNPNVTVRTVCSGYLTADSTKSFSVMFDPVDGDIAAATEVADIKAKTDNLPASPASTGEVAAVAAYVDTEVTAILQHLVDIKGTGWTTETLKTIEAAVINHAVVSPWDEVAAEHNTPGTMGEMQNDMGASSNPWEVEGLDTYPEGSAGKKLSDTGSAVSGIVTTLSGLVAAIWSYATRKLTSALTDEGTPRDMAAASPSIVVPTLQGSVYNTVTVQVKELRIPKGDTRTIPFVVEGDYSAWDCWFGAKVKPGDAAYTIEPKQCSAPVYDAGKNLTSAYVELTAADTSSVGIQWGEFELRNGASRLTPIQFQMTILNTVLEDPA